MAPVATTSAAASHRVVPGFSAIMRSKFGRNVGSTLITQGLSWGMAFVVTLFLPGYLGEKGLGTLTLASAFSGTFAVLVGLGTSTILVREIARHPERTRRLVYSALVLRALSGGAVLLVAMASTFVLGYPFNLQVLIAVALVSAIGGQIGETYQAALRGLERFPQQNAAALAEKIVVSAGTLLLVYLKAPLWTFAAVYLLGSAISTTVSLRSLSRAVPVETARLSPVHFPELRQLALTGLPFVASTLFMAIYGNGSSALLMSKLTTLQSIGWFGLAKRLSGTAQMIPVAIAGAMLPILSRLHHDEDYVGFEKQVKRMVLIMIFCAFPIAAILLFFPDVLIHLLHYPAGFNGTIPVLQLTGGVIVLWFLQQAIGTALVASNQQAVFAKITGIAAALAFPVCGLCIYAGERFLHNGAVGAVLGDALLEAVMLAAYTRVLLAYIAQARRASPALTLDASHKVNV